MNERTPWPRLLALSHALGLCPASFWRLSLREWRALAAHAHDGLTRAAFETLAAHYPDKQR